MPLLRRALASGKTVMCEKPLGTTVAEAREIRDLVTANRAVLVNGYEYPFRGAYQSIARLVDQRRFGKVTHVSFRNAHGGAWWRWFDDQTLAWFHDESLSGGGGMLDEGTHCVHLLRSLFGPVRSVWATAHNLSGQYPSTDDFGIVHMRFANGIFGTAEGSWVQTAGLKGLEITGSTAALYNPGTGYVVQEPQKSPQPVLSAADQPTYIDRLVAAIRGQLDEQDLRNDLTAALDSVVIMEAAARSVRDGRWIDI
jgi:predicted dehydrogenase